MSILPEVQSDVPPHLLHGKTETEKWMYNQQSIQRQLLERIVVQQRDDANDRAELKAKLEKLVNRVEPIEKLKERIMDWKTICVSLLMMLAAPLVVGLLIEWFKAHMTKP